MATAADLPDDLTNVAEILHGFAARCDGLSELGIGQER